MTTIAVPQPERMVRVIEVRIGDQKVSHTFGRAVPEAHARQWALHFVDAMTGFFGEHDLPSREVKSP